MKLSLLLSLIFVAFLAVTFRSCIEYLKALASITIFEELNNTPAGISDYLKSDNMSVRAIRKAFLAKEVSEGVGARVRRSIGTPQLRNLSPFLMLDHFNIKPGAGFPA